LSFAGIAVYSRCIALNVQGFLHRKILRRHLSFAAQEESLSAVVGKSVAGSQGIW
jgi:hypothetical protein